MTGPCTAIEPAAANRYSTGFGGAKRAVREQPMKADRDAEAGDHVHAEQDGEVGDPDHVVPEEDDDGGDQDRREDDGEQVRGAGGLRHVLEPGAERWGAFGLSPRCVACNL
jgi:hypothetical protein